MLAHFTDPISHLYLATPSQDEDLEQFLVWYVHRRQHRLRLHRRLGIGRQHTQGSL